MSHLLFILYCFFVGAFAALIGCSVMTHPIEFFLIVIPLDIIGYLVYLKFTSHKTLS